MVKSGTKRFYKDVSTRVEAAGFAVLLDGRAIKTPAGALLRAPTVALGEAIAAEWRSQGETLAPETMPLTKALNTALDRVGPNRTGIVDELAKYAGADLLCYRADAPEALVRRQAAAWDPWLDWAAERFGARLAATSGIVHVEQSADAVARIRAAVDSHNDYRLVGLHTGVTITGSVVLGLAFAARVLEPGQALAAASVDAEFQAERWGRDSEAEAAQVNRLRELEAAWRFLSLLAA
jgi:chaperone required for assembly of F1-ATPase